MSTAASFGSMVSDAVPCHGRVCCGHLSEDRDTKPSRGAVEPRYATFGSFVPLAMLCYGCQQNFAKASTEFACKYYMMDELKLDGVTIGRRAITRRKPKNFEKKTCLDAFGFHICASHSWSRTQRGKQTSKLLRFMTAAHVPWNIKPVLGMLSDSVTFCGFHRTSHLSAELRMFAEIEGNWWNLYEFVLCGIWMVTFHVGVS